MNDPSIKSNGTILILSLIAILFILWRVLVIGMSEYYVDKAIDGDTDAISRALSWNANHPKAQYLQARQILSTDPEKAENLLTASLQNNPTDTSALQAMAELQFAKGNKELSNKFMLESTRLAPANRLIRIDAGFFWAKAGQWDMAIENWQQALTTSPGLGKEIYPVLMQLAENEESLILLKPLIENPPEWWDQFSEYLAKNAKSLNTVATIASLRKQSRVPLSRDERKYLVIRLMKEGQWPRAYIAWANGLDKNQLKYMGSVYDGTFKLEASNEGFGWHNLKVKGVSIRKQRSYGSIDDEALLLSFDGKEMVFKHFFQPLYLTQGEHELTANLKTDRLQSRGGLKWMIRCGGDEKIILGESSRLLGSSEWRQIKFKFNVPESKECSNGQLLRLESTGERTYDHILEGDIWFDRVTIRSIPKPAIPLTAEQKAAKDKAAKEKAVREKAAREKAAKEKAAGEQAAREKAAKEKAVREKAAREKAAKEKAAREKAAREKAAKEKAVREKAAREKAAKEKAVREKAAREKAAKEKAVREKAAREKAAKEKATREKAAREKAAKEKAAREKAAREKAAKEKAAREQAAREKVAKEKAAQERAAREKAAKEKAEREQAAREKAAREQAAKEKSLQEQTVRDNASEDPVSREKFIKAIPVQSAASISDVQVRILISNYAFAYDTGDLTLMTRLFTDDVKTDDGAGIDIIKNDYSKLFLNSYERRIKIINTELDKTDINRLKVTFGATVQVRKSESSEWKNYSGDMQLETVRSGKEILISGLSHSITPNE